ncbi:MAG: hypothetical protein K2G49_03170 [Muribaculum sp.]|nr:hypothetical protein [Muribaculum sp.]
MKKLVFFGAISAAVLSVATFVACNSTEEPIADSAINSATFISSEEINEDFLFYLEEWNEPTCSRAINSVANNSSNSSKWDVNSAVQVRNYDKNLQIQMVKAKGDETLVAGAYYQISTPNASPMILQMCETSKDVFTMYDENGSPLLEMTYNSETNTAVCTKVVSRKQVDDILCNGAMAALGWEVSIILSVPTGGTAGLAFGLLWSVVSYTACN